MGRGNAKNRRAYYRLLGIVFVLILFGLVMVLSASSVRAFAETGDSYHYIKRQLVAAAIGTLALLFFSKVPLRDLQNMSRPAMYVSVALLVAVLMPGIGKSAGGAQSWIPVGGFQIQPSEIAKLAVIIFTADYFARKRRELGNLKDILYSYGFAILLVIALVMKQPDMGTTLTICMAVFATVFVGGLNLTHIAAVVGAGIAAAVYFVNSSEERLERITSFINPAADPTGAGWQIKQSLLAFGSGGLFGVGVGLSRQKYFYLPAAHTDFIFAIIGEELGLLGTFGTIALFAFFAYYGAKISLGCKNHFGRLLGTGITSMVVLQAVVNMGTVTAMLPITGIPMPFVSYGGSSLIVNLAAVGMLLSVAAENERGAKVPSGRSRRRKPKLYVVDDDEFDGTKPRRSSGKRRSASRSRKKSSRGTSKARTSSASSTSRSRAKAGSRTRSKTASKRSSSGSESSSSGTRRTQKAKDSSRRTRAHASSNKRRRNSRTRVSGSRSGRSTSKSKQ